MNRRWILVLLLAMLMGCSGNVSTTENNETENVQQPSDSEPTGEKSVGNKPGALAQASKRADQQEQMETRPSDEVVDDKLKDMQKLKQVTLGLHNYYIATKKFPMGEPGNNRVSRDLSWRVLVLPYLDLVDEYDKFDLSQPWNSAKNQPLVDSPAKSAFTLANGDLVCAVKVKNPPESFPQISDGTSQTVVFMGNPNAAAAPWSSPKDISIEEAVQTVKSLKKGESVLVALYDGSVQRVFSTEGKSITEEEIAALFNPRDGTIINQQLFSADP